ncbi:MAG TPA: gamma-glutamyl-gamma-aminobutyrate hydrolase family protein [Actinophytocola sp.]|uniref:gamma-glutamyl-gamma-aminobutyrate hydrolase family protein n=1 Tax=Actinophytocola sp. TaxID=1872138 RepID=UPI002DDD7813|nr:gamma-glutamyl-gamma-aminobutyrate hydrolase family protein [Actinophytocola sp.]HEV2778658.1 gamma-glutamyl-gamma-aminobutyrate hydrolase family protein [Actinophytocola sp.]
MSARDSHDADLRSRPLIGISCYLEQARFGVWDVPAALLARTYLDCVVAAGGLPVLVPPVGGWDAVDVSRLDGLVLAGGPDIDPACYHQHPHPETGPPRPERDLAELRLLDAALPAGVPVLGVCRGMQLINVACGGSLHQHLDSPAHRPTPGVFGRVAVKVAPDSRLAGIIGEQVTVSCHHHQGIDRLGDGLVPVGWAPDGTVEAVELPGDDFLVGVQWHPEEDTVDRRLFQALVAAA